MEHPLYLTNSLSRQKEQFIPLNPPLVGLYVCGPTVYGEAHLGHARPYITFDVLQRFLQHLGYKVRYVRNITDVGHLENDADEGEDKMEKGAKREGKTAQVKFTGLPAVASPAIAMFEEPRKVEVKDGVLQDWFGPDEVHVYKIKKE